MARKTSNKKALYNSDKFNDYKDKPGYKLLDEYLCMKSFKWMPFSENMLENLCVDIISWAHMNEKALRIEEYYLERHISRETWLNWLEKYPILKKAYRQAQEVIGMRTYKKAFNRVGSESLLRHMQYQYDPAWKEGEEYHFENKKRLYESKQLTPTTVIVKTVEYGEE